MFSDWWKVSNKIMASNYIGPSLALLSDMPYFEAVNTMTQQGVEQSVRVLAEHLFEQDLDQGNVAPRPIRFKLVSMAYFMVLHPDYQFCPAADIPNYEHFVQARATVASFSQVVVDAVEKVLEDCRRERRPDVAGLRLALEDFTDCFTRFEPVGKQIDAFNLQAILLAMFAQGIPDTHNDVQRCRQMLRRAGGREALAQLDAWKLDLQVQLQTLN